MRFMRDAFALLHAIEQQRLPQVDVGTLHQETGVLFVQEASSNGDGHGNRVASARRSYPTRARFGCADGRERVFAAIRRPRENTRWPYKMHTAVRGRARGRRWGRITRSPLPGTLCPW